MRIDLFDCHRIKRLCERLEEGASSGRPIRRKANVTQHRERSLPVESEESLEAVEVRIDLLKQESKTCEYKVDAILDRIAEIDVQLGALKALAQQLRENEGSKEG